MPIVPVVMIVVVERAVWIVARLFTVMVFVMMIVEFAAGFIAANLPAFMLYFHLLFRSFLSQMGAYVVPEP